MPARTPLPAANPGAGIDYKLFLDCIHCGLCLSSCPTYEELGTEMDGPRGRIYLMRAVTDGRLALDADVRRHLDLGLDRWLLKLLPKNLRTMQAMLPRLERHPGRLPELLPAERTRRARVALFTGCVADAVYPQTNWNTARVLQKNGCEVVVPRAQG